MKRTSAKNARIAGGILGGGVAAGLLLSLAIPTAMKQEERDRIEDSTPPIFAANDASLTTTMEAPAQDLMPAYGEPADSWGPVMAQADEWVSPVADPMIDADLQAEALPAELIRASARQETSASDVSDDAAASSAEAAAIAAADVRAMENGATTQSQPSAEPAPLNAGADFDEAFSSL